LKACPCLHEPQPFDRYTLVRSVGVDETHGRYGEVTIRECRQCGRWWLHYAVEYEAFTGSGRYFMGLIRPRVARSLAPDEAVAYLERLRWHLYGGSYYDGRKGRSRGEIQVDL
jgi:hypothetical protein